MLILLIILNQYCYAKKALILEGIYISENVISFQFKVHEAYIKPLKPRESLLKIIESDGERSEGEEGNASESDTEKDEQSEHDNMEDLIIHQVL